MFVTMLCTLVVICLMDNAGIVDDSCRVFGLLCGNKAIVETRVLKRNL